MGHKESIESCENVCKRIAKLGLSIFPFEIDKESKAIVTALIGKGENMYYLGMLSAIYNMLKEILVEEITMTFGKKLAGKILEQNLTLFAHGYDHAQKNIIFSWDVKTALERRKDPILIDGNTSISMGIIDAGIKLFSGYPITPASSIMHTLAKEFPSYGGIVHQAEDEIAAIGTAIGSYFGGVPSVTCTSGPGLSLKQEFIGFASAAEIPVIIIDAASGAFDGDADQNEQNAIAGRDLRKSRRQHENRHQRVQRHDCFTPRKWPLPAEKLRLPVFIMSDFLTANSYKIIEKPVINEIENVEDIPDFVF